MSDNTAASTPTPCKYRRFYESACRQCAIANNDGGPFLPSPLPAQCELVDKDALDALREAVKGCGEMHYDVGTVGHPCGSRTYSLSGCERIRLCAPCSAKRDAAMARLLGSEIEGDTNGR